jgi:hypothetical protein
MSGELGDLYEAKRGLCYDRSRAIEKVLSHLGFEVRHAAVYSTKKTGRLAAFLTPKTQSHAVTEVKTEHGWLVIDSNRRWIGLTSDGQPVALEALQDKSAEQTWDTRLQEDMSPILAGPYTYLFGLYSRHGRFYPPYTPVPDVDWGQIPTTSRGDLAGQQLSHHVLNRGEIERLHEDELVLEVGLQAAVPLSRGKSKGNTTAEKGARKRVGIAVAETNIEDGPV